MGKRPWFGQAKTKYNTTKKNLKNQLNQLLSKRKNPSFAVNSPVKVNPGFVDESHYQEGDNISFKLNQYGEQTPILTEDALKYAQELYGTSGNKLEPSTYRPVVIE